MDKKSKKITEKGKYLHAQLNLVIHLYIPTMKSTFPSYNCKKVMHLLVT